jgi:hypothetical protein
MTLSNSELNNIMRALRIGIDYYSDNDPYKKDLQKLNDKLKEFMETSGTTCPTAILSCPQKMGSCTSAKKKAASAANGVKGGRPHKDGTPANHKTET